VNSEPAKAKGARNRFAGLSPAQQQAALAALTLRKEEVTFWSVMRRLLPQVAIWLVIALVLWGIAAVIT
jgi:hypothetical protein